MNLSIVKALRRVAAVMALLISSPVFSEEPGGITVDQEQALRALARSQSFTWPELDAGQISALREKAEAYFDIYQKRHLRYGQNADVWYTDYDRSKVYRLEGLGDSAAWTGHYLAALAARYFVEPSEGLRASILSTLDIFDLLTKVSGREGYIARFAGPASDEGYREYYKVYGRGEDPERPGFGKRAFQGVNPYTDQVWLGYSSRDTYDGTVFGLAATLAYVKDPEISNRIKQLVERIADRLIADKWDILDGKGNRTRATGMFKMPWLRLMLSASPERYTTYLREYDDIVKRFSAGNRLVFDIRYREYFANNLRFIRIFATTVLEDDPIRKELLVGTFRRMHEEVAPHLNAHFAALYAAATGDKENPKVRAAVQGLLADFPAPPKFGHEVDLRKNPAFEQFDAEYTTFAQLPRERVPTDFMWQRSPCVSYGSWNLPYELPGIDMFLPYWMGRLAGVINPLPSKADSRPT